MFIVFNEQKLLAANAANSVCSWKAISKNGY